MIINKLQGLTEGKMPKTKKTEKEKIQTLQRKCLFLWKAIVKHRAGGQCEGRNDKDERCKAVKFLNAHHIESYITNKYLRYDTRNGICLCPKCHKFGHFSAHRSFVFMYELMTKYRKTDLYYLLEVRGLKSTFTVEDLSYIQKLLEKEQENDT